MAPKAARKARSRRSRGDNGAATQETTTDMDAHSTGAATTATSVDGDGPRVPGVSRERALFFATGQRAAAPTSPRGAPEAWPGYFQTARDLSENRLAAQAARVEELQKKDQAASDGADQKWSPRKKPRQTILTTEAIVPSLRDMALATLAQCVEQIEALGAMDAASRHEIARIVAANRRMTPDVLRLFIFAGVDGVDVPDCSAIDEESFVATVRASTEGEGLKLTVLRLGLCGRCITDCVIEELGNALQTVEILSLRGCYRLSDAGCKLLVRECAPSLREFELSCNQRISKTAIDHLSELKQLSSLTIAECPQLDDAALEALLSMTNLRKLSLDQMEKISDEFVCQLVQKLPHLEEVSLARCSQLTDVAVRTLLESCRELKVLDLSDLDKITDAALEAVRTLRHPLRQIKLRRCLLLTDAAVDHVAFGAQSYLEDLVVSSVPQLTNAAITSLQAHCGATIRALDVSFCRKITEDALGIFTDSAHSLKSLALLGCTQVSARFLQCHSQEDLVITGHPLLTGLTLRY
ncbi:TPA: hypothetical protein N0F65_008942 [Lagenidium giganteum]|uniref:F-box/LRR-repeat protein 15-like leucin rich repeat domain-containing protein n=1 Tax=Lagenidium giganteum TaxID=4803 RepID=A0AAV2YTB7_9STRA|nr:TPA: hypothetical protein N0F65_008942 [Lagenidium giganteum]